MLSIVERKAIKSFNKNAGEADRKRDEGLTTPKEVERIDNINYGDGSEFNLLDLYRPAEGVGKLPVIVSCHGGGYVYGSKEVYQYFCMEYAKKDFAVINFNYHLAPEITFPSPIIETNKVMEWVCENADKYGFDTQNVFLIGDSAGAQLASQYAAVVTNEEYAKIMEISVPNITLRAISLACGIYDISPSKKSKTRVLERIYLTRKPEKFGEKLNVMKYIGKNYPPTYIFSAPGDFLLQNLEPMKDVISKAGVEVESKIYGDENTLHVFHCNIRTELSKSANDDTMNFFRAHIQG